MKWKTFSMEIGEIQIEKKSVVTTQLRQAWQEAAQKIWTAEGASQRTWVDLFEMVARHWIETKNEALIASIRANEFEHEIVVDVAVPTARMISVNPPGAFEYHIVDGKRIYTVRIKGSTSAYPSGAELTIRTTILITITKEDDSCCVIC